MADIVRPPLAERLKAGMEETLAWARGQGESRVTIVDGEGRRHGPELLTAAETRDRMTTTGAMSREYIVIYEQGATGWTAYAPDVPGCIAVGETREVVEQQFKEALEMHLDLLRQSGESIPEPTSRAGLVSVAA